MARLPPCARRIQKEIREWVENRGVKAGPLADEDVLEWQAVIYGPENSLYEGGTFYYKITFPQEYPFKPPQVHKITPMLHVNIHPPDCHMCLPKPIGAVGECIVTNADWAPRTKLYDQLLAIRDAMKNPYFAEPGDMELVSLYEKDRNDYAKKIREHVIKHAIKDCHR